MHVLGSFPNGETKLAVARCTLGFASATVKLFRAKGTASFFFFFTLVTGLRRFLSLELSAQRAA